MRNRIRIFFTFVFSVVLIGWMVSPTLGEWFVEVARDKGLYQHAGARWDGAVSAVFEFFRSALVLYSLIFLAGLVVGLWADRWLKGKDIKQNTDFMDERERIADQIDAFIGDITPMVSEYTIKEREAREEDNMDREMGEDFVTKRQDAVDKKMLKRFNEKYFAKYLFLITSAAKYIPVDAWSLHGVGLYGREAAKILPFFTEISVRLRNRHLPVPTPRELEWIKRENMSFQNQIAVYKERFGSLEPGSR